MKLLEFKDHEHFLKEAFIEAEKSTCEKQKVGALIVKDNKIIARGYNHKINKKACDECLRKKYNLHKGENVEICYGIHAEQDAILNALNEGIDITRGVIYIVAIKKGKKRIHKFPYCTVCSRIMAKTKLKGIFHYTEDKLIYYTPDEDFELAFKTMTKIHEDNKIKL